MAALAFTAVAISSQQRSNEIYTQQCVVCHGDSGKGNGIAAVAFNPKPVNFTESDFGKRSLEDVIKSIVEGRGAMPAYGTILQFDEIQSVAEYILTLSN